MFDCFVQVATLVALAWEIFHLRPTFVINFFKMMRITRLVRSLKASRSPYLHVLKTLMFTLAGSANAFVSSILLVFSVMSAFGLTIMQGLDNYLNDGDVVDLGSHGEDTRTKLMTYFGSFSDSIYTLLSCITGGMDWQEVASAVWQGF